MGAKGIVEPIRQNWTDDRLDDRFDRLEAEVKAGDASLRKEVKESAVELRREIKESAVELRREIKESGSELRKEIRESGAELRKEIREGDAALHSELASINRTLIQVGGGIIASVVGAVVLTQL